MPNAKEVEGLGPHKLLVLGGTGSGKTTQLLTLPGRKFAYLFDPNALLSLRGYDIEYEEFLPDRMNLQASSLSKDANKGLSRPKVTGSKLYNTWEDDFNHRLEGGYFDSFDVLALDSGTTFLDLIMDQILTLNSRFGQWPHEDDWGPQMIVFKNVIRAWTGLNKMIYVTGHLDARADKVTKKVWEDPMMTGRLRQQIPLLFSDVFSTQSFLDAEGNAQYVLQTVNEKGQRFHRTSIRGLDAFENVTLDFNEPLEGQGLGGLINWWTRQKGGTPTSREKRSTQPKPETETETETK